MEFSKQSLARATTATATAVGATELQTTGTATANNSELSYPEQDLLFDELHDLTNQQFRAWYCLSFAQLGRETVQHLAAIARTDHRTDSRRYFSWLLKQATQRLTQV